MLERETFPRTETKARKDGKQKGILGQKLEDHSYIESTNLNNIYLPTWEF